MPETQFKRSAPTFLIFLKKFHKSYQLCFLKILSLVGFYDSILLEQFPSLCSSFGRSAGESPHSHLSKLLWRLHKALYMGAFCSLFQLAFLVIWSTYIEQLFLHKLLNKSLLETLLLSKFCYFSCHFAKKFSNHFKPRAFTIYFVFMHPSPKSSSYPFFSQRNFCLLDPELAIIFKLGIFLTISRSHTGLSISFRKQTLLAIYRNHRWIYTIPGSAWQSPSSSQLSLLQSYSLKNLEDFFLFISWGKKGSYLQAGEDSFLFSSSLLGLLTQYLLLESHSLWQQFPGTLRKIKLTLILTKSLA